MNKLDIHINQATLEDYSVQLDDDKPVVTATIGLFAGNKRITSFVLRTGSCYNSGVSFQLPPDMVPTILKMAEQLEVIMVKQCRAAMGELGFDNA